MKLLENKILDFFSNLTFEEDRHIYTVGDNTIKISVSGLIKKYEHKTDWEIVARRKAEKEGVSVAEIKKLWKEAGRKGCERGTKAHKFGELYPFNRNLVPTDGFEKAIVKFWNDIPEHIVPLLLEVKMYHKVYMFAGTADILLYNTKTNKIIIGDYKGLPLDTPILTSNGWKNMESLKIGDKVFDKDGKLCNVKIVSGIHNKKCLKIIFDNNEEIVSDFEHRWLVSRISKVNTKNIVMTTQEIQDYYIKKSEKYGNNIPSYYQLKILNPKPLDLEEIQLPIDPYVLGVWLGDGHKQDGKITQQNEVIWEEIRNRGYKIGKDLSQGGAGKASTRTIFGISKELKNLNLIGNKHLPEKYLLSSYEQRLDLLRGFMDADGYYNPKRKRFVLGTTKQLQVDIAVQLLASLGIKSTVIECNKYCNDKVIKGWDICFTTTDFNPFLKRNQNIIVKTNKQNKYRRIVAIEEVEQVPTKCIEVDSSSHTFLAGKTLIPTHNTNIDLFKNFNNNKMVAPFNNLLCSPFNHYQLQLSFYQILLEQVLGIEVSSRKLIWLKQTGEYLLYNLEDYTDILKKELENIEI